MRPKSLLGLCIVLSAAAAIAFAGCRGCRGKPHLLGPSGVRGAALMDDSTLWDPEKVVPAEDAIQERDWAFTALGGMNAGRLAVKMDYFIDKAGKARDEGFSFLDRQLYYAAGHGLGVILDMHAPPGGAIQDYRVTPETLEFWGDAAKKDLFVKGWAEIARRYAGDKRILAFELMNEPSGTPDEYWNLMRKAVAEIRKHDRTRPIIIQADRDWKLEDISDGRVAYSFHFYDPIGFTHQGAGWDDKFRDTAGVRYPGPAAGSDGTLRDYGRGTIRDLLSYPALLSRKTGAPVIIGEFGVSTAADEESAARWISDVLWAIGDLGLDGYIYWRQIADEEGDISKPGKATMAVISAGGYASPAQFFGIRPDLEGSGADFDFVAFYRDFGKGAPEPASP